MQIPPRESDRRRLALSVIACSVVSLPFALAGLRYSILIPFAWIMGWLEYRAWKRRREARRAAAESGPGEGVEVELPNVSPLYASLSEEDAAHFRSLAAVFLNEHPVTAIAGAEVSDRTKAIVAAAAVTLLWGRPEWEYPAFGEVLIYPGIFSDDGSFRLVRNRGERGVLGMAHGLGVVILSLPHLEGSPGLSLALHELAHILDGPRETDGIPSQMTKAEKQEWAAVMEAETGKGLPGREDLPRHSEERPAEFFAEAADMFFTRPALLASRRPALYDALVKVFRQDPSSCRRIQESPEAPPACREDSPPPASSPPQT